MNNNRLGKMLFWILNSFVVLFLAAAMSLPALATTTAGGVVAAKIVLAHGASSGDPATGLLVLSIVVMVFLWCSIWPARFFWVLTMTIRIPVLVLILLAAGAGKLLMRIDHVVALAGRRVLEVGNAR